MKVAAAKADEDYNKFQLSLFQNITLVDGEEEELEKKQSKLNNVSEIKSTLWDISSSLDNERESVLTNIKSAISKFNNLSSLFVNEYP